MSSKIDAFDVLIAFIIFWSAFNLWIIFYSVYDLSNGGIIDTSTILQSMFSAFYGDPFINTVPGGSFFSVHASTIMFMLLPFFAIGHNFMTLYSIQDILVFSSAVPFFLIAKEKLDDEWSAFFISVAYIISPLIQISVVEVLTLFLPFIIFSYYFYVKHMHWAFIITLILSMSTMEFNPIITATLGFYFVSSFLWNKWHKVSSPKISSKLKNVLRELKSGLFAMKINQLNLGVIVLITSIAFLYLDDRMILYFSNGTHLITSNLATSNISSLSSIISTFKIGLTSKIDSLLSMNEPFLFLSLLDPFALLELPWFFAYSITDFGGYWQPGIYYMSAYVYPFAAISAVFGLHRIYRLLEGSKNKIKVIRHIAFLILIVGITFAISDTFIPMSQSNIGANASNGYAVQELSSLIPVNASVYTGVNELPIVSSQAYNTWFYGPDRQYVIFKTMSPPDLTGYGPVGVYGEYALYERNYSGNIKIFKPYLHGSSSFPLGSSFSYHPLTGYVLPKGNYDVNLNINYFGEDVIDFGSGGKSTLLLNDTYALVYPFKTNQSGNIIAVTANDFMWYGYYDISEMITTSLNITSSSIIEAYTYATYQDQYSYGYFPTFANLKANQTYYLWLWSSGDPGGLYFKGSYGSSNVSYIAKIYNNSGTSPYGYQFNRIYGIKDSKFMPSFSLIFSSRYIHCPSNISISVGSYNKSQKIDGEIKLHYSTSSPYFYINSTKLNGSLTISYTLTSDTGSPIIPYVYAYPYAMLAIPFGFGFVSYFISGSFRRMKKRKGMLSYLPLFVSLALFYVLFSLNYFDVVHISMNIFTITGIASAISFFYYILNKFGNNK
ncbi:hypothetical protein DMB44_03725 [Thermoplasma sp. Kam2015]|uniref:DUF2079 domain-containing protein n=1 Tax=Thermoplasma sp. Kam2015 TaxID=2094122 RepID=UPI000D9DFA6A|nr:DUF2079 domain-containing protein [Thermoplasma sp. Kam2015]PYB68460.1 hypothetical protein DMB44_03725 [Thermoplasma sp. Kam2015]